MKTNKILCLILQVSAVLILFCTLVSSTASAISLNIADPYEPNSLRYSNGAPVIVAYLEGVDYNSLSTEHTWTNAYTWTGDLTYTYLDENKVAHTKITPFSVQTQGGAATELYPVASILEPLMIDAYLTYADITGGKMKVTVTTEIDDTVYSANRDIIFQIPNQLTLDVSSSTDWIVLHDTPYNPETGRPKDGGSDQFTLPSTEEIPAKIDIVVKKNGQAMPDTRVRITAITVPGSGGHGGPKHFWEMDRDPELQTDSNGVTRPWATLEGLLGTRVVSNYPDIIPSGDVTAITDSLGMAHIKYTPPYVMLSGQRRVVSGTDSITVSLVDHPEIKKTTQIKVGYDKLEKFVGDEDVKLDPQGNIQDPYDDNTHDDFYCTAETSRSIHEIADKYRAWYDQTHRNNGQNNRKPLEITAISLQYGGLSDIGGNWLDPHSTHSNGKCVDIRSSNLPHKYDEGNYVLDPAVLRQLNRFFKDTGNNRRAEIYEESNGCLHFSFKN